MKIEYQELYLIQAKSQAAGRQRVQAGRGWDKKNLIHFSKSIIYLSLRLRENPYLSFEERGV
jgi:hypothetical protein